MDCSILEAVSMQALVKHISLFTVEPELDILSSCIDIFYKGKENIIVTNG